MLITLGNQSVCLIACKNVGRGHIKRWALGMDRETLDTISSRCLDFEDTEKEME